MSYTPSPWGGETEPPVNGYHPKYDNFECHRVVVFADPADACAELCDQDDDYSITEENDETVISTCWSVYGHNRNPDRDGGLEWIADCGTFSDAAMIVKALAEAYEIEMEPVIMGEPK